MTPFLRGGDPRFRRDRSWAVPIARGEVVISRRREHGHDRGSVLRRTPLTREMAKRVHQQRTPPGGARMMRASAGARGKPSRRSTIPIVGVGASAGGFEAFSALL